MTAKHQRSLKSRRVAPKVEAEAEAEPAGEPIRPEAFDLVAHVKAFTREELEAIAPLLLDAVVLMFQLNGKLIEGLGIGTRERPAEEMAALGAWAERNMQLLHLLQGRVGDITAGVAPAGDPPASEVAAALARKPQFRYGVDFYGSRRGGDGGRTISVQVHRVDGNPAFNSFGEPLVQTGITMVELLQELAVVLRWMRPADDPLPIEQMPPRGYNSLEDLARYGGGLYPPGDLREPNP